MLSISLCINTWYLDQFTVYQCILSCQIHCIWIHNILSISLYVNACYLFHFTVYRCMYSCPFHCVSTYVILSISLCINVCHLVQFWNIFIIYVGCPWNSEHFSVKLNSRDLNGFCLCTHFPTLMAMFKGCLQQCLKNISISVHVSSSHSSECLLSISGILFPAWTGWYQVALV